ncbi:MAG: glycosyltransferase family 39 protein [Acidobacteriota bacterium]
MTTSVSGSRREKTAFLAAAVLILLVFLTLRLMLCYVRSPFFDELFTVWIARRSPGGIVRALLGDSGPPLYYWIVALPVHLLRGTDSSIAQVPTLRLVSLLFSFLSVLAVLSTKRLKESRWIAAVLLSFFPASVYFATEARAYALCGMLVAFGVLAVHRWTETGSRGSLVTSFACFFLAACCHYYGVLFLAVPFVVALLVRREGMIRDAFSGSLLVGVAYSPFFWLASRQPHDAIRWMASEQSGPGLVLTELRHLGFAAPFPAVFLPPPAVWIQMISLLAVAAVVMIGSMRSMKARLFGVMTLTPLLIAAIGALAGKTMYYPLRFESVLAVPLMLWLAFSLRELPQLLRSVLVGVFVATGGYSIYTGVLEHRSRPDHPYRLIAESARRRLPERSTIVVSGLEYLEVISQRDGRWSPEVLTFPSRQQRHPGWREAGQPVSELAGEAASLPDAAGARFFWIGELGSDEQRALSVQFTLHPILSAGPVVVAVAESRQKPGP